MLETIAVGAGGLALFLLAMRMMTDGLKLSAGGALRRLLAGWTSTPLRGVAAGMLVTGVVQSSSAVTVATIGFVNAGMLSLSRALGVVYGTNVGTTMTSWLVSLVGFGFRIEIMALPLIAVGMVMLIAAPNSRFRGFGEALAGFGVFFLGLSILRDGLAGLTAALDLEALALPGMAGVLVFVGVGFVATLLVQSSSAAIALILTAAGTGIVGLDAAAASVIGANLGTTSTAAFAVIGATPNARRVALGHIVFNAVAGALALMILGPMLWLVGEVGRMFGGPVTPAVTLALFHTAVKLLGLAIMMPLTPRLTRWLGRRFRTAAEDAGRPRFLDDNVRATPALALAALHRELGRMHELVRGGAAEALSRTTPTGRGLEERAAAAQELGRAIADFVTRLDMADLPREVADGLAQALRTGRYLAEGARLAPGVAGLAGMAAQVDEPAARDAVSHMLVAGGRILALGGGDAGETADADADSERRLAIFEDLYQSAKLALLQAGAGRRIDVDALDALLTSISQARRMVEQIEKARVRLDAGLLPPNAET
jgi:phosphate:Na+ symporter